MPTVKNSQIKDFTQLMEINRRVYLRLMKEQVRTFPWCYTSLDPNKTPVLTNDRGQAESGGFPPQVHL